MNKRVVFFKKLFNIFMLDKIKDKIYILYVVGLKGDFVMANYKKKFLVFLSLFSIGSTGYLALNESNKIAFVSKTETNKNNQPKEEVGQKEQSTSSSYSGSSSGSSSTSSRPTLKEGLTPQQKTNKLYLKAIFNYEGGDKRAPNQEDFYNYFNRDQFWHGGFGWTPLKMSYILKDDKTKDDKKIKEIKDLMNYRNFVIKNNDLSSARINYNKIKSLLINIHNGLTTRENNKYLEDIKYDMHHLLNNHMFWWKHNFTDEDFVLFGENFKKISNAIKRKEIQDFWIKNFKIKLKRILKINLNREIFKEKKGDEDAVFAERDFSFADLQNAWEQTNIYFINNFKDKDSSSIKDFLKP